MKKVKDFPPVYIKWDDSASGQGDWTPIEELIKDYEKPALCHTLGFLIFEDDTKVIIVPHMTDPDGSGDLTGTGDMAIPKSAILALVKLDLSKDRKPERNPVTGFPW